MITASTALWVLIGLVILLAVIIPILDATEKLSRFTSLRWTCVAIILIMMVAVILDFQHLSDETRNIILQGGLIIVGGFLALRTFEKILFNGWLKGINLKGTVQKGDVTASINVDGNNIETKVELPDAHKEN